VLGQITCAWQGSPGAIPSGEGQNGPLSKHPARVSQFHAVPSHVHVSQSASRQTLPFSKHGRPEKTAFANSAAASLAIGVQTNTF